MAITALLLAGCDNEEQKVVPDPIKNGRLEAEPSDTWMSDFTTTDDEVRFRVEANETEELREGTVSLPSVKNRNQTQT